MNLEQLYKFEDKILKSEYKRLLNLGYSEKDAHEISITGIDSKITRLLLLELVKQGAKKW